eukprot:969728_1
MISPDIGLYNNRKTISKTNINNTINTSINTCINTFKSPSHYMSRGRRAWYKAQKQLNNNKNDTKCINKQNALIIPSTPIHKKVNAIVMEKEMNNNNNNNNEIEIEMKDNSKQNSVDEEDEENNSDEMKI